MKRLILFLLALPLVGAIQPSASSLVTIPDTAANIGYSTVALQFSYTGTATQWRLRVNPSASCAAGAGTLQAGPDPSSGTVFNSNYRIIAGGLNPGQHYWLCVELDDGGGFTSSGASGEVQATTSSVVENEPRPVEKFDSTYPNTGDFATMPNCTSGVNAQSYCFTPIPSGTTDIRSFIETALNNQCTHGTVLTYPHSATPVQMTGNMFVDIFASCAALLFQASSITGNNIDFGAPHGLSEGDLLTFGNHGFHSSPSTTSCYFGNGMTLGAKFLAHIISANVISLLCGDGSNNPVVMSSPGDYPSGQLYLLKHVRTTGQCPSILGTVTCSYWKVPGFEVIIRSDSPDALLPPPGTRINPAYFSAGLGAILVNQLSNVGVSNTVTAFFNAGDNDPNVGNMVSNLRLGPGIELTNPIDTSQRTFAVMVLTQQFASNIVLDRVYLHGQDTSPPTLQRWGGPSLAAAAFEGTNIAVRDSYIDNLRQWHATNGIDGSSILTSVGPGPTMWVNTYIEGAGIPIHMDDGGGTDFVRGNFAFIRNTFHSPTFMMHGGPGSDGNYSGHRQHLEFKAGWGIEVMGNVFDTNWVENNPNSMFVVCTSVSPPPNPRIGEGIRDVNISNNIFRHGPGGIGPCLVVYGGGRVTSPPNRFAARNNLFTDIDGRWTATSISVSGAKGWWMQANGGMEGLLTDHNTWVGNTNTQPGSWIPVINREQNTPMAGWVFTNNFVWNLEAVSGWGLSREGGIGVDPCFNLTGVALANACFTPSYKWLNNVMMSPTATAAQIATNWSGVIASNYNPTNMSLSVTPGWMKYDSSGDTGDYRLKSTSDYRSGAAKTLTTGPASDGADVGVDMTALLNATGHVRFASVTSIGTTTAQANYISPDNMSCVVRVTSTTPWTSSSVPTSGILEFADGGTAAGPRQVALSGLAPGTLYFGNAMCGGSDIPTQQPTFQFRTQ